LDIALEEEKALYFWNDLVHMPSLKQNGVTYCMYHYVLYIVMVHYFRLQP